MAEIQLDVLFKKIQKDDKKEILEFHVLGDEIEHKTELISMAGGIAILGIGDIKLSAEFKSIQRDSKKVALKFEAKGDSEEKTIKLYPKAGFNVRLSLEPSQMGLEDFSDGDGHEGLEYGVTDDGTVQLAKGQLNMNDVPEVDAELPFEIDVERDDDDDDDDLLN